MRLFFSSLEILLCLGATGYSFISFASTHNAAYLLLAGMFFGVILFNVYFLVKANKTEAKEKLDEIDKKLKQQYPQAVAAHEALDTRKQDGKTCLHETLDENKIAQNGFASYVYAKEILKDRFKAGEHALGNHTESAQKYGHFLATFYKGNASSSSLLMTPSEALAEAIKLPIGDPRHNFLVHVIKRHAWSSWQYLTHFRIMFSTERYATLMRWFAPTLENDPKAAVSFAQGLITHAEESSKQKELEPVEDIIAKDSMCSYTYARNVLRGRFIKGEPAIAEVADLAVDYAIHVLKGKFEAAEKAIAQNLPALRKYNEHLALLRTNDQALIESMADKLCSDYLTNIFADINGSKVVDGMGRGQEPSERLMRSIEKHMDVDAHTVYDFRRTIAGLVGKLANEGKRFTWTSNPRLKSAILKVLEQAASPNETGYTPTGFQVRKVPQEIVRTVTCYDEQQDNTY